MTDPLKTTPSVDPEDVKKFWTAIDDFETNFVLPKDHVDEPGNNTFIGGPDIRQVMWAGSRCGCRSATGGVPQVDAGNEQARKHDGVDVYEFAEGFEEQTERRCLSPWCG
jgi:hypothetical protein